MLRIHWERWKRWDEHPEYKVSSDGRVKKNGKLVHLKIDGGGYMRLDLEQGEGIKRFILVHRLVCHVFRGLEIFASEPTVDHLNHNKRDNSLKNLEIVSAAENLRRAQEDSICLKPKKIKEITQVAITPVVQTEKWLTKNECRIKIKAALSGYQFETPTKKRVYDLGEDLNFFALLSYAPMSEKDLRVHYTKSGRVLENKLQYAINYVISCAKNKKDFFRYNVYEPGQLPIQA